MTNYWKTIRDRLHEESGLHYPYNKMGQVLETYFNGILNTFQEDNRTFLDQGFLITTDGQYLDLRGQEFGLPRKGGTRASGMITFILTTEIENTQTPSFNQNPENSSLPESVRTHINKINTERTRNGQKILDVRNASSTIKISKNTTLYNDAGFEYILNEDVTFEKGNSILSGKIIAKEGGSRFNTNANTITRFNASSINKDLIITNVTGIYNGSDGETDDQYRQRLLNNISTNISVNFIKRQGVLIYSKEKLDDPIRLKMTSFNPYMNNKYATIPPRNEVESFLQNELIANDNIVVYKKGW